MADYSPAGSRRPSSAATSGRGSRRGGGGQAWGPPGGGWEEQVRESPGTDDFDQNCGSDSQSALRDLAFQNSRLKQKLGRTRAKSQERVSRSERTVEKLGAENAALQRECESLRTLFIRQQQQQIAFWTGPFMEMLAPGAPKECGSIQSFAASLSGDDLGGGPTDPWSAAATAAAAAAAAAAAVAKPSPGRPTAAPPPQTPPQATSKHNKDMGSDLRALSRERDYWRLMATELRERQSSTSRSHQRSGRRSSAGSANNFRDGDELSTSVAPSLVQDGSSEYSEGSMTNTAPGQSATGGYSSGLSSSASSLPGTSAVCGGGFANSAQWQSFEGAGFGQLPGARETDSRYPATAVGGA